MEQGYQPHTFCFLICTLFNRITAEFLLTDTTVAIFLSLPPLNPSWSCDRRFPPLINFTVLIEIVCMKILLSCEKKPRSALSFSVVFPITQMQRVKEQFQAQLTCWQSSPFRQDSLVWPVNYYLVIHRFLSFFFSPEFCIITFSSINIPKVYILGFTMISC